MYFISHVHYFLKTELPENLTSQNSAHRTKQKKPWLLSSLYVLIQLPMSKKHKEQRNILNSAGMQSTESRLQETLQDKQPGLFSN